ncbi:Met-10+ like-protein-domain-containing protein [Scheffersomyces amazonensis]|uniref:Met-10+ like-protein-domain-containing protein n=1 Tax=Scheffersomyces amazonensis TaxID=1078765 RepID=UPI00315CD8B1
MLGSVAKRLLVLPRLTRTTYLIPSYRHYHGISKTDRRDFMMTQFGPPINRSMKELDRSFFKKDIQLIVAYFPNPVNLSTFVKVCKNDVLYLPSIKHIVPIESSKAVLLKENYTLDNYQSLISDVTKEKIKEYGIEIRPYTLKLGYEYWKSDDILRAILPEELLDEIPTGFAQAGHVAHLNLRDEFKPYGKLIGEVILDKNPKVRTVVDKVDTIDTKFRTFKMNVLAGVDDLLVEQSESGCRFKFDFSKVYWNSRLSTEHERLINSFAPHEVVVDVFAGVGPFAVPAAKKEVIVLGNDLNPESYKYLQENIKLNHVEKFLKPYNLDGREIIRQSPKLLLQWIEDNSGTIDKTIVKRRKVVENEQTRSVRETNTIKIEIPKYISHFVMNLPDSALTFLDEFIGLYSEVENTVRKDPNFKLPIINVHCFEKFDPRGPEPPIEELHAKVHARIVKLIDFDIPFDKCHFHLVRKVAPTKPMFCVSFELPEQVAFRKK